MPFVDKSLILLVLVDKKNNLFFNCDFNSE
jgi:hypothetical protein